MITEGYYITVQSAEMYYSSTDSDYNTTSSLHYVIITVTVIDQLLSLATNLGFLGEYIQTMQLPG